MSTPGIIDLTAGIRKQERSHSAAQAVATGRGTTDRFTVAIEADTLAVDLSDKTLRQFMEVFVAAVGEAMGIAIDEIAESAAPSTIAKRERARINPQGRTFQKNYAGGRIGIMLPKLGAARLFNDSGRMKLFSLRYRKTSRGTHECTLNWPANRFNPQQRPAAPQMLDRLQQVCPAFRGQFTGRGAVLVQQALDLHRDLVLVGKQEAHLLALQKEAKRQGSELMRLATKFKGRAG